MKASLKGKYEYETEKAATSAISTLAIPAGDLNLRASITDASFVKGPSLNGLSLSLEKPGFFVIDYNVPKQLEGAIVDLNMSLITFLMAIYASFFLKLMA
ncbi:Outer envelope pore protein 24A chloroplastic [Bienertia sinuspersici]